MRLIRLAGFSMVDIVATRQHGLESSSAVMQNYGGTHLVKTYLAHARRIDQAGRHCVAIVEADALVRETERGA
jgi:hypothetical protein